MIDLSIDPAFKRQIPQLAVAVLTARVVNSNHQAELWQEIEAASTRFRGINMDDARKLPAIQALRRAYRALGNDPTRYRGSNEALVRRISQGKELYRVNTLVDVINLLTLETLHSGGTFDLQYLQPPIVFRAGRAGEAYAGIGRGEINIAHLPVFADQAGPFGSTTSDSERAMIRSHTRRIMMVVISFLGASALDGVLPRAAALLEKYARGAEFETAVVE